jgi:hypothetical protein
MVSGIILILVVFSIGFVFKVESSTIPQSTSPETVVKFEPQFLTVYPGQNFTVVVLIENVSSLYGFDIQITWSTTHLKYLSHTATIPVETYSSGVLHEPLFGWVKNDVDENASMSGAAPETRYWIAVASKHPAPVFNGSGSAFLMTFKALNQTGTTTLNFTYIDLSDDQAVPIPHSSFNCTVDKAGTHDIAVTNVTLPKTIVGEGCSATLNVTLENQGADTEAFNVTTYANTITIQTKKITLGKGNSTTATFTWSTTGVAKGNYTIAACAEPILGETDTADNNFTDGWIIIAMIGDITGPEGYPDGKCDMRDIGLVARHFGQSVPPAPANCDITGPTPGVPDCKIDMRDIGLVARHFGEKDP